MERTNSLFCYQSYFLRRIHKHPDTRPIQTEYIFNINVFHWIYTCLPPPHTHSQTCEFFSSLNLFFTVTFYTSYSDCSRCRRPCRHLHRGSLSRSRLSLLLLCEYLLFHIFYTHRFDLSTRNLLRRMETGT